MKIKSLAKHSPPVIITGAIVLFNAFLLFQPALVIAAARDGLQLWFNQIVPALLPFVIAVNLLAGLGFIRWVSRLLSPLMSVVFKVPGAGAFALLAGFAGGYPMGAKTVAQLRLSGDISRGEAQRLLAFCNNAGPLFVIGFVGVGLFGRAQVGYRLWAAHALAALIVGIGFRFAFPSRGEAIAPAELKKPHEQQPFGKILGDSVQGAMESMLIVCGYVVFFCALIAVLEISAFRALDGAEYGFAAGLLEMANGARVLAQGGAPNRAVLATTAAVIAFGGFSIHAQSAHFLRDTDIRFWPYLLAKALQSGLSWGIVWWVFR